MNILTFFEHQRTTTLEELIELTKLEENEVRKALDVQIKKRRIREKNNQYTLKSFFKIGLLDVKEHFSFLLQETEDLYLENSHIKTALHGDKVLVKEGAYNQVVEVLERKTHQVVCSVKKLNKRILIIPKITIRLPIELVNDDEKKVLDGDVILVEFKAFYDHFIEANLVEKIGHITDPDIDILTIVYQYQFPYNFSQEALIEAENLENTIAYENRLKVTDEFIITIDGKDAKDLDDAISLKVINNQYHLSVHIADVSYYVRPGSYIDQDAYKKATSAYLADRVIPMLPRRLSNDLCSLNVGEEKYALSVFMILDENAQILSHDIKETIIDVDKRLSYDETNDYFDGELSFDEDLNLMLDQMLELSNKLTALREKRGALEFTSEEYTYLLDEDNQIEDIILKESGISEGIIESFMILTNETVSEHLAHLELPSIYRVHEVPKQEKLKQLFQDLKEFEITIPKHKKITPMTLQTLLKEAKDSPLKHVINELILRSMNKARYDKTNFGHFGLASRYYSHFTAPIRRYPDLLLHRLVRDFLIDSNNLNHKITKYDNIISEIAKHSSIMEKKAEVIEREVDKLKITEYMASKVGTIYPAVISGFIQSGFFVRIKQGIEGLVPLKLANNVTYNSDLKTIKIGKDKTLLKMGSPVKVKLYEVNKALRQITFKLVD